MNNEASGFVDVARFDGRIEAEALKSALERQMMEVRVFVESGWGWNMLSLTTRIFHVQVREDCRQEACKYLHPEQRVSSGNKNQFVNARIFGNTTSRHFGSGT